MILMSALVALAIHGGGGHGSEFYTRDPELNALVARAWDEQAAPSEQDQKRHKDDIARDAEMGRKYSEEVAKQEKFSENADAIKRVERIGAEMAEIARVTPVQVSWGDKRLSPFDYTFKVIKGDDVNAFSLPGGFIYIYEGLVKYAESDDELAGVIAHEISHAAFRHVAWMQREQSKLNAVTLPLILIGILAGAGDAGLGAFQLGSLIGQAKGSGWSLQAEDSADYGGFQYMARSKYNAVGMVTFMERLARDERGRPDIDWGIYQTHPLSRKRASSLYAYVRDAGIPVRRSLVTTTFRTLVKPGENGIVELSFAGRRLVGFAGTDALERADEAAKRLDAFFDETPELFYVSATDDQILYRRNVLLELTQEDAAAAKSNRAELTQTTLRAVRASLFALGYRIWDLRG